MTDPAQDGLWRYEPVRAVCYRLDCSFEVEGPLAVIRPVVDDHVGTELHAVTILTEETES